MSSQEDTPNSALVEGQDGINLELCRLFDPTAYNLDPTFRLTRFADLTRGGCKVAQEVLGEIVSSMQQNISDDLYDQCINVVIPLGVSLNCSVIPLRYGGLSLLQTMDLLYPIVDDPYMMGKITCANILGDLYAMGVTDCDNMLMLLSVSTKMSENERDAVVPLLIQGFKESASEAGTVVSGGDSVLNPWCTMGGLASAVCQSNEYIVPDNAMAGDVLVMTKPLGNQVAMNVFQWLDQPERWNRISTIVSEEDVYKTYHKAIDSMARLNRTAARLMHKYNAHCATVINGCGILGHAEKLAANQRQNVSFVIHNLPIIGKMAAVDKACGNMFQLLQGYSKEISGGLLVCMPQKQAAAYCKDLASYDGCPAWIIGIVEHGNKTARIVDKPRLIEASVMN